MSNVWRVTLFLLVAAASVKATQGEWQQCGGIGWTGGTVCTSPYVCTTLNSYYFQCLPGSSTTTTATTTTKPATTTTTTTKTTTTTTTTTMQTTSRTTATPTTTNTSSSTTSKSTTTTQTTSTSSSSSSSPTCSAATSGGSGTLSHTGVNIAGFDFTCTTSGSCTGQGTPPLTSLGGPDGAGQMQHFVTMGMNTFRLPVAWQSLTPTLGGTLDSSFWSKYDALVQACLGTGAWCIIDIHNYARWNGNIIGQSNGAVTNAQFASLWSQIAIKYASSSKVIFGVMNEPHDIPDIYAWAVTVQGVVTAIRSAGATSQIILLPGNDYTSAQQFVSNGSAAALGAVKNLDGSITNLIFDVHKYLDSDNSGTHAECVTDNVSSTFAPLAQYLRCYRRQAMLSETGGGNVASCIQYMCSQNAFIKANSDVFLGWTGWSAGAFATTYILSEVPTYNGGAWTDQTLVSSCMYQTSLP